MGAKQEPYATIDRGGVRVHIPREDQSEISFVLNIDNAAALCRAVVEKVAILKTGRGALEASADLVAWLFK